MSTIKFNELASKGTITLTDLLAIADANGVVYKSTTQKLQTFLNTIGTIGYQGVLLAASATASADGIYLAGDSGTYTNNGGLVVNLSNTITFISVTDTQTTFSKVEIPLTVNSETIFDPVNNTQPATMQGIDRFLKLRNEAIQITYENNKNLFSNVVWGEYVKEPAAAIGEGIGYATNYARSLLIEVEESTAYTMSGNPYASNTSPLLCFDEDFKELGLVDSGTATNTTLANTKYVTFTVAFNDAGADFSSLQFEKGSVATPYEENKKTAKYSNDFISVSEKNILGATIKKSNGNEFLLPDVIWGQYVKEPVTDFGNNIGYVSNYATSGYVKVEEGETYLMSGNPYKNTAPLLCFDENLKEVAYLTTNTDAIPSGVSYVMFTVAFNNADADLTNIKFIKSSKTSPTLVSDQFSGITLKSNYQGKKILWTGTSIPATPYSGGFNYPTIIQEILGSTIRNTALSGAPLRTNKVNGDLGTGDYLEKNFTRTKDEIQTLFSGLGYTQPQIDALKLNSYEEKLIPYADYDLIVFDWSVNDYAMDTTDFNTPVTDFTTRNRHYYVGAFNYAIEKLLEVNPRARFCIVSHWNQNPASQINIQKQIAEYWGCPFIDLSKELSWSPVWLPTLGQFVYEPWCPDGTHPHTDTTGQSIWIYAKVLSEWIKTIY